MKKRKSIACWMAIGMICLYANVAAEEIVAREKAMRALEGEDYRTAIAICRSELASDPDHYEFGFILSRAYAFSGEWNQALEVLARMLTSYPDNADLILLQSRIQAWEGRYEEADAGFRAVLANDPENKEALIGRAEIASWKNDFSDAREKYREALGLAPDDPVLHYRIGRVYLWAGNYSEARRYFGKACELDPDNIEYKRALKVARPEFMNDYELRVQCQNEDFSDDRGSYTGQQAVFSIKVSPRFGSVHLKYDRTRRYGEQDTQFGIELYPHLWKKAYGYIDCSFSPDAIHYPNTSFLFEVYQSFFHASEVSLGYRRMNFASGAVSVYLGSFGYYLGSFYPFLRWYYTPEDEGRSFSWTVNVRRYFTKDSYLALGYGQGSRPFDIITIEDILIRESRIFLAEWNWFFLKRIRLRVQFTHRNEKDGPTRNAIFVATGYRW
jgi:YaiO family outer membrane protein